MKAISLPTNMVVVIVLAVIVLTVVVVMFTKIGGDSINTLKLERERASLCKQYVRMDPDCDGEPKLDVAKEIQKTCKRIGGYNACSSADASCIQECCSILCVTTTSIVTTTI